MAIMVLEFMPRVLAAAAAVADPHPVFHLADRLGAIQLMHKRM